VAKALNLKKALQGKYDSSVEESVKSEKNLARRRSFIQSFSQLMGMVPFLVTFGFGGYWTIQGFMTVGSLLAFINLLNRLTYPISSLPQLWGKTKSDMAAVERIFEIIDSEPERDNGRDFVLSEQDDVESIKFSHIDFAYPGQEDKVFNNLVFVSTHDIELTDLLKEEYSLYHFSEVINSDQVDFDYKLKSGKLKTRNAIRILKINQYPNAIIDEAKTTASHLEMGHN
jgi:ABC-type multidrug transport system fused ATPase/permease subunit